MRFVANRVSAATERTFDGRTYLVAPVVMLQEGVLNDSFVPREEVEKYTAAWNGRPLTLNHPQRDGEYVSAGTPEFFSTVTPGQVWNTVFEDGKLKAEIWIDVEKAKTMGGDAVKVLDRLRSNQPVEVSTGYFADNEMSSGVYNGQTYHMISRNIRPDHLALLPNDVGACSWQDGCGTPRVNCDCKKGQAMPEQDKQADDTLLLQQSRQIADQTFVSAIVEGLLSALGRGKTSTLAANADQKDEERDMDEVKTPVAETPETNDKQADVLVNVATMLEKMNQRIDAIDAKLTANAEKERNDIVAALAVNERCPFDEGELKALPTAHLHKLAATYQADYSLSAGVVANRERDTYETLAMPAWAVAGEGK